MSDQVKVIKSPEDGWLDLGIKKVRAVVSKRTSVENRFIFYREVPNPHAGITGEKYLEKSTYYLSFDEIEYLYKKSKEIKLNQILLGEQ